MRQKRKLFLIHSPAGMHDSEFVVGRPIKLRYGPAKQKSCSGEQTRENDDNPLRELGGTGFSI